MLLYGKKENMRYYSIDLLWGQGLYQKPRHMPRLDYYQKKTEPSPLTQVGSNHAHRKIMQAVRAIEMHMALSCIAMGTIQCLSLRIEGKLCSEQIRYQRTPSKGKVSEGAMMQYLRKHIFRFMGQNPELHITRLIHEVQEQSGIYEDSLASKDANFLLTRIFLLKNTSKTRTMRTCGISNILPQPFFHLPIRNPRFPDLLHRLFPGKIIQPQFF